MLETSSEQQHLASPRPAAGPSGAHPLPAGATLDDQLEYLISWCQTAFGVDELVAAREEFWVNTGKVFTADPFYDARISYFFDHYLFERPQQRDGATATPYEHYLRRTGDQDPRILALGGFRHSLFQIAKVTDQAMVVDDLIAKKRLQVRPKANEIYTGLEKKTIFQGFVFPDGDIARLSPGIVLHPQRVASPLKRHLKLHQKAGVSSVLSLLFKTANLQIRHLRHKHVEPKTIYKP